MKHRTTRAFLLGSCLAAVALLGSGCGAFGPRAPLVPPPGIIFTQYSAPLDIDLGREGEPTPVSQLRSGESDTQHIFIPLIGFLTFTWGDMSIDEAARNGNLNEVHFADYDYMNILGIYQTVKINAYGN